MLPGPKHGSVSFGWISRSAMTQARRTIPANYPQPLGAHLLRAETQRQIGMVRQEIVTDLLSVLNEAREPNTRSRLIKLVESNLRSGLTAIRRAEDLWPELEEAQESIAKHAAEKPALAKKHLKLFESFDRVQRRYLEILHHSFANTQVILDRLHPVQPAPPAEGAANVPKK